LDRAEANQRQAEHRWAENYLDRALGLCEREEIGEGLLWLVRSLETAPEEATDLRRVIRTNLARWRQKLHAQHRDTVPAVAFSRNGQTILTRSYDKTARLWQTSTGKSLGPPLLHPGRVQAVAFNPDGRSFVTGSWDGTARLWEVAADNYHSPWLEGQGPFHSVVFSPDNRLILTGSDEKIAQLWEATNGKPVGMALLHPRSVHHVAFGSDGRSILTVTDYGQVRLWEAATGKLVEQFVPDQWFSAAAVGPDEQFLLTGTSDHTARLGKAARVEADAKVSWLPDRIASAAFSHDGRFLLTGSQDKTARLWDVAAQKPIGEALPHSGHVCTVAFSPDDRTILTATTEGMFQLWEKATGKPLGPGFQLPGETGGVSAFSPDGRTVLTVYGDGKVWLRDVMTGKRLGPPLQHGGGIAAVAFSRDGQRVLTSLLSGWTARWELPPPVPDEVKRVACWVQVLTGMALDGDGVHALDAATRNQRRRQLEELGGPPDSP
jgi:WD40 repeat protein